MRTAMKIVTGVMGGKKATFESIIVPTLGNEIYTNPGMEGSFSSGLATGWTKAGTPTLAEENTIVHSGAKSQKITGAGNQHGVYSNKSAPPAVGDWIQVLAWGYRDSLSSGDFEINVNLSGTDLAFNVPGAAWLKVQRIGRHKADTSGIWARQKGTTEAIGYLDDCSIKVINLVSTFGKFRYKTSAGDVIAFAKLNVNLNSQIGFWINVDDPANPTNGVLCYTDGATVFLEKVVNGTYSAVASTTSAWTNGDELKVIKIGTGYVVYKNGIVIISSKTISDATIKDNTNHVQFSTYSSNSFSSFNVIDPTLLTLKVITIIGDSIPKQPTSTTGFSAQVAGKYNYGYTTLIDRSVASSTVMADMATQVAAASGDNASIIICEHGTNDLTTDDTLRSTYENNLNTLKASNSNARIFSMGILDKADMTIVPTKNTRIQLAASNSGITFWDTTGWIIPQDDCVGEDIHPNLQGATKITSQILARL